MPERANDNGAITRLPVLLPATGSRHDGWITGVERKQLHGEWLTVLKRIPVRVISGRALEEFVSPKTRAAFQAEFGGVPGDFCRQLLCLLGIVSAAEKNDLRGVAKMAERASAQRGKLAASWEKLNTVISPWDKAAATLNTGLFGIMPVMWQREAQLVPALFCRTPSMALFAHALFAISGVGACRRCGNPFFASRNRQSYCSYQCRVAAAMKRYRHREKLKKEREGKSRSRKRGRRQKP